MDVLNSVAGVVVIILGGVARYMAGALALLLVLRALFIKDVRDASRWFGKPVYSVTGPLEQPLRRVLPDALTHAPHDFTPLIVAVMVLFIGLGAYEFFDVLATEVFTLYAIP